MKNKAQQVKSVKKVVKKKVMSAAKDKDSKKKLATKSLDEFINSESDNDSQLEADSMDEENGNFDEELGDDEYGFDEGDEYDEDSAEDSQEESDVEDEKTSEVKKHKETLKKMQEIDPDFYNYLEETNSKGLLDFDTSDSEDERGGEVHETPRIDELEVASDESDFEDKESSAKRQGNVITQTIVDQWQQELQNPKCIKTIANVVSAFRSAVQSVTEEKEVQLKFKVQGSAAFNAVVRLCIVDLIPALKRFLKSPPDEKLNVERCKSWIKVRLHVKAYLADVIRLMGSLTESSLLSVVLKHIHQLIPFYVAFIKLSRVLCKKLVTVWCSGEDTIRVLAFLSILRLARTVPNQLLEPIIKAMYLSYARNCKFTSPSTWPVINFMRRSLVEIMALQESLTYKHAFLYIRQLAIHLRNAITLKKKDAVSTVYNWQFVHCLHLWAALLGSLPDSPVLKPLLYPLVQIAMGTINLVATGKYYPLRFHVVSIMNQLAAGSGVYIPQLPFLLEIMQNYKFDKKASKVSMKPLDLSCVLRVSQSQMGESGFRDSIVDSLYEKIIETLECQSHCAAFPEMALPAVLQLKAFIKKCPLANYNKKMKQLMEKIQETIKFVEKQRSQVHFDLADTKAVLALENQLKQKGTPLSTYYASWKKIKDREMAVKIARKPQSEKDDGVPILRKIVQKSKEEHGDDSDEMNELFPSDVSEDEDDEDRFLLKEERGTKRKTDGDVKEAKKTKKSMEADVKTTQKNKKKKNDAVEETKEKVEETMEKADGEDLADEVCDFNMSDDDDVDGESGESDDE